MCSKVAKQADGGSHKASSVGLDEQPSLLREDSLAPLLERVAGHSGSTTKAKLLPVKADKNNVNVATVYPPYQAFTRTTARFLDLFHVGPNDPRTHAFDLIDGVPAYYYSRKLPDLQPGETTHGPIHRKFDYCGKLYNYTINPVWIEDKQVYPGEREEFVYQGLKRLAAIKEIELLDGDLGLKFTLHELQLLLSETGHTYSYDQIKNAIMVLCKSPFEISSPDKQTTYIETRLSSVGFNGRGSKADCYVKFNTLTTRSLRTLGYKGHDFKIYMRMSKLARRLYERMCLYFSQASMFQAYTIFVSTAHRNAGIALVGPPSRWAKNFEEALAELKKNNQIQKYSKEAVKVDGKTMDYKFFIFASRELVSLVIGENERKKKNMPIIDIKSTADSGE